LTEFYDTLSRRRGSTEAEKIRSLHDRIEQLDGWMKRSKAPTARIAVAKALTELGWVQRGSGIADTVSRKAMIDFHESLRAADVCLKEAEELAAKTKVRDPVLYQAWMSVGIGSGFDRKRMQDLLDSALKIDPLWTPAIRTMADYLMPKWHGNSGDLFRLADHVAAKTKLATGEMAYAVVVAYAFGPIENALGPREYREFSQNGFQWKRTREGLYDWLKQSPDGSLQLSYLLRYARIANDRDTAADAVERLKGKWNPAVFPNEVDFLRAVRWSRPDFREGKARLILDCFEGTVTSALFLENDSVVIATGYDSLVRRYDVKTGKPLAPWDSSMIGIGRSVMMKGGSELVLGGFDRMGKPELIGFDMKSQEETPFGGLSTQVYDLAADQQGKYVALVSTSDINSIRRWELSDTPQPYEWHPNHSSPVCGIAFSPDGTKLASVGGKELILWDLAKRTEIKRWNIHDESVASVAWSPTGQYLATAGAGNEVRLWDADAGTLKGSLVGGNTSIGTLAFSSKGDRLVGGTGSWTHVGIPGEVVVWSVPEMKRLATLNGHGLAIRKVVISSDDRTIASASEDGTLRLWEMP
jgi:hypothetical protein